MSDSKGGNNDPSMDDILASIRKIISDDEAKAQGTAGATPASPQYQGSNPPAPPQSARDDVLLLTDLVDEPPAGPAAPAPKIDLSRAAEMPQPTIAPPISVASPVTLVKQPRVDQNLVEPTAAGVAASAFDRLSQAVQESVPMPAATDPGPSVGPSGRNLEDIVKELLKPMLKEWLDKNLPTMVERFVEREIVRLTRR